MTRYKADLWHPRETCFSGCYRLAASITTVSQEGASLRMTFYYMSSYIFFCMHLEALPIFIKARIS